MRRKLLGKHVIFYPKTADGILASPASFTRGMSPDLNLPDN